MITITAFDVSIGTKANWIPAEIVPVDRSRTSTNEIPNDGKEYRYWRLLVTEAGESQEVEGRLLIAGINCSSPGTATVLQEGVYRTWVRLITPDEIIIEKASTLTML